MSDDRTNDSGEREKMKAIVDAYVNFDPEVELDATTPVPLRKGLAFVRKVEGDHYLLTGISPSPYMQRNIARAYQADKAYKDAEAERRRKVAAAWAPIAIPAATVGLGLLAFLFRLLSAS